MLEDGTISCFDVGISYTTGATCVAVGVIGSRPELDSNVLIFQMNANSYGNTWHRSVQPAPTQARHEQSPISAVVFNPNVIAVKFDPNYQADATIMAVYTKDTRRYLWHLSAACVAANTWNASLFSAATDSGGHCCC